MAGVDDGVSAESHREFASTNQGTEDFFLGQNDKRDEGPWKNGRKVSIGTAEECFPSLAIKPTRGSRGEWIQMKPANHHTLKPIHPLASLKLKPLKCYRRISFPGFTDLEQCKATPNSAFPESGTSGPRSIPQRLHCGTPGTPSMPPLMSSKRTSAAVIWRACIADSSASFRFYGSRFQDLRICLAVDYFTTAPPALRNLSLTSKG
ncbi:hypothetical protein VTI74DRAFT_6848 [Chaetomium olivicolor]